MLNATQWHRKVVEVGGGGARSLERCEVVLITDTIRAKGMTIKEGSKGILSQKILKFSCILRQCLQLILV